MRLSLVFPATFWISDSIRDRSNLEAAFHGNAWLGRFLRISCCFLDYSASSASISTRPQFNSLPRTPAGLYSLDPQSWELLYFHYSHTGLTASARNLHGSMFSGLSALGSLSIYRATFFGRSSF